MIDFPEVMQRVKNILIEQSKKDKILDRDLAHSLYLNPQYFAVIKKRNKIPYEHLAYFCKEREVNLNWVLLKQKPKYL